MRLRDIRDTEDRENRLGRSYQHERRMPNSYGDKTLPSEEDVIATIVSVIRTLDGVTPEMADAVTPETNILRDLSLDSIAVMDFIMELETAFNTVIPLDTVAEIATVGDLARAITAEQARTAA
jgi:acyl carrier protein